jgi:hypothetical protein
MFTFRGITSTKKVSWPSATRLAFVAIIVSGCGSASTRNAALAPSQSEFGSQGTDTKAAAGGQESVINPESTSARQESTDATPTWLQDGRQGDPAHSLPRLSFQHLGMHIGGGANDAESKKPWLRDIEAASVPILECYKKVRDPLVGGSYGIDLYVEREGGSPDIRGSRQKIGAEEFDACMKAAFRSIQFHRPERPTVVSYSLLFQLDRED